jgi:hypothetical protein
MGNHQGAAMACEAVTVGRAASLGERHWETLKARAKQGSQLLHVPGRAAEGRALLETAVPALVAQLGAETPAAKAALRDLQFWQQQPAWLL